jgi:hypothetical protein
LLASAYAANEDWENAIQYQTKAEAIADLDHRSEYTKTLQDYQARRSNKKKAPDENIQKDGEVPKTRR